MRSDPARAALRALPAVVLLVACQRSGASGGSGDSAATAIPAASPAQVASSAPKSDSGTAGGPLAAASGFRSPEALVYDSTQDVFFVSNVNGHPNAPDGNGFISRVSAADGRVLDMTFIGQGKDGIRLNSPMGSRIRGDTLWVADIDKLHAFDDRTGRHLRTIDLAPVHAKLINDFTFTPGGEIYLTDMGQTLQPDSSLKHTGPDRILRVGRDGRPSVALDTLGLNMPDGIAWDDAGHRLLITPFAGGAVLSWTPGERAPRDVAAGGGKFDGIEAESDGTVLLTSWNDSTVYALRGGRLAPVVSHLASPSDVSLDTRRHRLGVSEMNPNTIGLWAYPAASGGP